MIWCTPSQNLLDWLMFGSFLLSLPVLFGNGEELFFVLDAIWLSVWLILMNEDVSIWNVSVLKKIIITYKMLQYE